MARCTHLQRGAAGLFLLGALLCLSAPGNARAQTARLWQERPATASSVIQQGMEIFVGLAEHLSPAVVNISTEQHGTGHGERHFRGFQDRPEKRSPFGTDPFREFFERFFGDIPQQGRQSLGSGFIINTNGLILTNDHVIEAADVIKVITYDEREYEARVVGRDPQTDVALIKIPPRQPLPTAPLGDSDALRIGEWVMAIGNPFGLSHTVTAGIVSAKGRVIGVGQYDDFIQTDASINPGNSGGPLFNTRGEVVGINTAIISGGTGIGFAIPINLAKALLPQLHARGKVIRGWLGVTIQGISPELARSLNLPAPHGALVSKIIAGSPAERGGLQRGDVITSFDGIDIQGMHELPRLVAVTPVGKRVSLRVWRHGRLRTLVVTLGKLQDDAAPTVDRVSQLGMEVEALTPELAQRLGLGDAQGVLVTAVESDRLAAEAGVQRGDVIMEVNRQRIRTPAEFTDVLQHSHGQTILLLISRGDKTLYVALKQ
jgi:serine protease Do